MAWLMISQLYRNKVGVFHRPFVPTEQTPKKSRKQETGQPPRSAADLWNIG